MKGPGGKVKYTSKRHWECPACRRKEWTPGHVTFHRCKCVRGGEPERQFQMKLVEEMRRPRPSYPDPEKTAAPVRAEVPPAVEIEPALAAPDLLPNHEQVEVADAEPVASPALPETTADAEPTPETDTTPRGEPDVPENGQAPPV